MSIRGEFLDRTEEQLNTLINETDPSEWENYREALWFRRQCIKAGFHLTHLYPVYHQGWECDEWGAIGTKDDRRFRLETNHGSLQPEELKEGFPLIKTIKALFFGDDDIE